MFTRNESVRRCRISFEPTGDANVHHHVVLARLLVDDLLFEDRSLHEPEVGLVACVVDAREAAENRVSRTRRGHPVEEGIDEVGPYEAAPRVTIYSGPIEPC